MKIPSSILGVFIALIVAFLVQVTRTASNEVVSIAWGVVFAAFVGHIGFKYRTQHNRDQRMIQNGVNHYRTHVHNRRVVRKTS